MIELLELPPITSADIALRDTLVLDVAVTKYQAGTDFGLYSIPFIPIFWRPSINILLRVRSLNTGDALTEIKVRKVMGWWEYIKRVFSIRSMLRFSNTFDADDLKELMAQALLDGLIKSRNKI